MNTMVRLPLRQSGPRPPLIRGGGAGRLMRGIAALGVLLALGFGVGVGVAAREGHWPGSPGSLGSLLAPLAALSPLTAARAAGNPASNPASPPAAISNSVVVISVNGAIGPGSADFIVRGLERAASRHAQLAILQLDTPGGLDTSMRQIIKAILASPVPVATFIAPSGARAASAGTYIVYASHIAAMAPGTNLGAATPIQVGIGGSEPPGGGGGGVGGPGRGFGGAGGGSAFGGAGDGSGGGLSGQATAPGGAPPGLPDTRTLPGGTSTPSVNPSTASPASSSAAEASAAAPASTLPLDSQSTELRKQVHDAAAYIRGLAQMRGRNADWAERAVREAVSLSDEEALAQHVVDVVARDVPDLLRQLDGRTLTTSAGAVTLHTAHAPLVTLEPDWRSHFLAVITDPSVALVLLMLGMYGLFFEFANPGFVLPGVVGAISLLLGLFAMQMLPISYVGLGLIFLGIAFLIGEAFLPTFGSLGFGGVVAFVIGAMMLMDTDVPGYGIPLPLIAAVVVFSVAFVLGVSRLALRARRRPVVTGSEALIGCIGVVLDGGLLPEPEPASGGGALAGWARVHGERWRVSSSAPAAAGQTVRVTARHGLTLTVVPVRSAVDAPDALQGERS
ncbi:nodulation protein NfeD [Paraburkholderia sp. MMS20-SJTR3]|uniref:Nodulation protein NfeD n=1 Tax=Paraburkholderia sejongensis TaxID=2886946 RepID=A0ABS8K4U1_9BURK|nr:nodulation protein NfeD [Paraburkholderia sp. MMS20-SJTR3]MCC8397174.1 nodulation protein NfeD [Paraburkholderia sp. MMS20-SJTR3]